MKTRDIKMHAHARSFTGDTCDQELRETQGAKTFT